MAVSIDLLIEELRVHAPTGVQLPRGDDNQVRTATLERWAAEAARRINERREVTTIKEEAITLTPGEDEYAMPAGAREALALERQHGAREPEDIIGVSAGPILGYGPYGQIPTGQELDGSLDLIGRQALTRSVREDHFEVFGGKLRINFVISKEETAILRYRAIDDSLDNIPADYFDKVLLYMRFKLLDWWLGVSGVSIVQDGSSFGTESVMSFRHLRNELARDWLRELNSIGQEA